MLGERRHCCTDGSVSSGWNLLDRWVLTLATHKHSACLSRFPKVCGCLAKPTASSREYGKALRLRTSTRLQVVPPQSTVLGHARHTLSTPVPNIHTRACFVPVDNPQSRQSTTKTAAESLQTQHMLQAVGKTQVMLYTETEQHTWTSSYSIQQEPSCFCNSGPHTCASELSVFRALSFPQKGNPLGRGRQHRSLPFSGISSKMQIPKYVPPSL